MSTNTWLFSENVLIVSMFIYFNYPLKRHTMISYVLWSKTSYILMFVEPCTSQRAQVAQWVR
jgi:hypothetical protein